MHIGGQWATRWLDSTEGEQPVILQGPVETDWPRVEQELSLLAMCSEKGCGSCADCRHVRAGGHSDIVRLDDEDKTLKVRHVRVARERWHSTPFGRLRLIIIPRAERLTDEAGNMLLKDLEEASRYNRFLLWTSWPGRLLGTIRSRSQLQHVPAGYGNMVVEQTIDWEKLVSWKRKQPYSDDELQAIYQYLQRMARTRGVDSHWFRASLRLRDFYRVNSTQGNTRMATDVLLASLRELRYQRNS